MSIFVSYSQANAPLVKTLVEKVESGDQVKCWYFGRDSQHGTSYLKTIETMITNARLVLLIVSEDSLESEEVGCEVKLAHQSKIPILPVFLGCEIHDVRGAENGWALAFGTNVGITLTEDYNEATLQNLAHQVRKAFPESPEPKKVLSQKWVTDGLQIEPSVAHEVIFRSRQVTDFIEGDQYFFVSANKGCGKTLLLQCKRAAMQKNADASRRGRGVQFIPANNPYLDMLGSDLPTLRKSQLRYLSEIRNARRIWSFAIRASAISYFSDSKYELLDPEDFFKTCGIKLETFLPAGSNPTVVFKALLALNQNVLNKLLDKLDSKLDYSFRQIHSAVVMFIDRVDQALAEIKTERRLSKEVWINVQAGLVEAIWDLRASNNHVKVFASIREEAFASYESDSRANLVSSVLQLRYQPEDMKAMLNHLVKVYEDREGIEAFVGLANVRNAHARTYEEVFPYVLRHTRGRPRDIVTICKSLSQEFVAGDEARFRTIVNQVSSNEIVRLIFTEMKVFLECLKTSEARNSLFSLIPYNVLSREDINDIASEFNRNQGVMHADFECNEEDQGYHPFCELYNCGLIGYVEGENVYDEGRYRFKKPWDVLSTGPRCLPVSKFYVLHPSLQQIIQRARPKPGYYALRYMPVGDGMRWRYYFPSLRNILVHCIKNDLCETDVYEELATFLESCLNEKNDDVGASVEDMNEKLDRFKLDMAGSHEDLVVKVNDLIESCVRHVERSPAHG